MKIGDLKRNDVDGALAYIRQCWATGREVTPEEGQMLLMLQDDHAKLLAGWQTAKAARGPLESG